MGSVLVLSPRILVPFLSPAVKELILPCCWQLSSCAWDQAGILAQASLKGWGFPPHSGSWGCENIVPILWSSLQFEGLTRMICYRGSSPSFAHSSIKSLQWNETILSAAVVCLLYYLSKLLQDYSSLPFFPFSRLQTQEESSEATSSKATSMASISGLQPGAGFIQQLKRFFIFLVEECGWFLLKVEVCAGWTFGWNKV